MKAATWPGQFGHPDTTGLIHSGSPRSFLDRFREKRWVYVGVVDPGIIFGCAVIHLGYVCSAFMFVFDRKTGQQTEKTFIFPPVGQARFDRNPETGRYTYRSPAGRIDIQNRILSNQMSIRARTGLTRSHFSAELDIAWDHSVCPVHFLMPMHRRATAFTTKAAGLPVAGCIRINDRKIDLTADRALALYDWTNGFYPRHTFWNWACGAGQDAAGNRIGFNFSRGVYQYGGNENTVWINGRPHHTGPVRFSYETADTTAPWRILSDDRRIALSFKPEGQRRANDNLGIVKSRFIQSLGAFNGRITTRDGTYDLPSIAGVAEEHHATW